MLQPLDVGVLGPFSRAWIERCSDYMEEYLEEIPRDQFVKHYAEVRKQTFKDTTIRSAFRKSGIWPINHDLFSNTDFAASINTSSTARDVPASYPIQEVDDELPTGLQPTHPASDQESDDDNDNDDPRSGSDSDNNASTDDGDMVASTSSSSILSDMMPIPPSRFYSKAPTPPHRGRDTEAYISALENQVGVLREENEELAAHATLAFDHVRRLKHCLNAKIPGSKQRKLNTDSRWLNSDEGLAQCEIQEAEERGKAAEKQARADERQAEEQERQRQREQQDPNIPFVGSLNGRKKAELQDIAYSLGLDIGGKVEDLKLRINTHFDEHEDLRTSPRYIRLFPQLARQAARQTALAPNALHSLRNITNTHDTSDSNHQYNHTIDRQNNNLHQQQYDHTEPLLAGSNSPQNTFHRPPGPSNWPLESIPLGYIAHIPPYYQINSYPVD